MGNIVYWTTSTCGTCGVDGWNLMSARRLGITCGYHCVDHQPDPDVIKAKEAGFDLPYFTDGEHYWHKASDILKDTETTDTEPADSEQGE